MFLTIGAFIRQKMKFVGVQYVIKYYLTGVKAFFFICRSFSMAAIPGKQWVRKKHHSQAESRYQ